MKTVGEKGTVVFEQYVFFRLFASTAKLIRISKLPRYIQPTNKKARLIIKSVARVRYHQKLTLSPIQAAQQLLALRPILVTSLQS